MTECIRMRVFFCILPARNSGTHFINSHECEREVPGCSAWRRRAAQVGIAITEMDDVTQQNAALVEQSAAAAENLKRQSHELVATVSIFKI